MLALVMATALAATPPTSNAHPACSGKFELIRSDQIKPGKLEEFMKAVRDHQAWYVAHGLHDRIYVGRILSADGGSEGYSSSLALTVHTDMTTLHVPAHAADDAAWNTYVAEYRDSSTMVNQVMACVEAP